MNTSGLAYLFTKSLMNYQPIAEVKGALDNPIIELSHQLTKIEDGAQHPNTDEIPWCSSWVNLVVLLSCLSLNPSATIDLMLKKKYAPNVYLSFYAIFMQIIYPNIRTGIVGSAVACMPTFDASAISWAEWGTAVKYEDAVEGDIVVMSRLGGNHVTFLAQPKLDMTKDTFLGLGGNQSDKVCVANESTSRIIAVRRA